MDKAVNPYSVRHPAGWKPPKPKAQLHPPNIASTPRIVKVKVASYIDKVNDGGGSRTFKEFLASRPMDKFLVRK